MKAILVKHLPATNTRPARVKASAEGVRSLTLSSAEPEQAALALARRMGWTGSLVSGGLPNGNAVFCFVGAHGHKQPQYEI